MRGWAIPSGVMHLLFFLIISAPASGHQHHHCHGDHGHCGHVHHHEPLRADEIPLDGLTEKQYRQLLDEAHHAIEEHAQGRFIQRWRNNFRFKRNILNAYRWYSSHRGVPYAENAAANLAAMFVTSHALETVGGLALASSGVAAGFDGPAEWLMTTVGVTVTIPGLDPMCLLLVGAYGKWPARMDRMLTVPRLFVVKGARAVQSLAGLPEGFFGRLYGERSKRLFLERFHAQPETMRVRAVMARDFEFHVFGTQVNQEITLRMRRGPDGRQALTSLSFSEGVPAMVGSHMSRLLKPFGRNIRELGLEMDRFIGAGKFEAMDKLPYVERVDRLPWRYTVYLKDNAFPFHSLDESDFDCESLLVTGS